TPPQIAYSSLGRISLTGAFAGLSIYTDTRQLQLSQPATTDGLYTQLADGTFVPVAATDGKINSVCSIDNDLYVGGNFTTIAGVSAHNIALWSSNSWAALDSGLLGIVNSLLCDSNNKVVTIGGDFQMLNSSNVVNWKIGTGWRKLPFGGFDGPVYSIAQGDGQTRIFGGRFDSTGNGSNVILTSAQTVNIQTANISADGSTSLTGFSSPSNIICPSAQDTPGSTWLAADNRSAYIYVVQGFTFRPTKLRIRNTMYQGRGTKTFRFIAYPISGIMNLTYTDSNGVNQYCDADCRGTKTFRFIAYPISGIMNLTYTDSNGVNQYCDADCPLNQTLEYQDFTFVNIIGMIGFQFAISDWYGDGAGLNEIAFICLTLDIAAFAVQGFNDPSCSESTLKSSSVITGGPWKVYNLSTTSANYLTTTNPGSSVTFLPHLSSSGNYAVRLFTPGCVADETCGSRGQVKITIIPEPGLSSSITMYQTNNYDKYDSVYEGKFAAVSSGFRPSVTLTIVGSPGIAVAQKVQFLALSTTSRLNGLYEYNPANFTSAGVDIGQPGLIVNVGNSLSPDAFISNILKTPDTVFIAGNFSCSDPQAVNILTIGSSSAKAFAGNGLNGQIRTVLQSGDKIYFGGDFTGLTNSDSTTGLNYIAAYTPSSNTWSSLSAGLNGKVEKIVQFTLSNTTVLGVSGGFTQIVGGPDVNGFAIWGDNNWLTSDIPFFDGQIDQVVTLSNSSEVFVGVVKASYQVKADGAVYLSNGNLESWKYSFSSPSSSSTNDTLLSKRDVTPDISQGIIRTGVYYNTSDENLTILGGNFSISGNPLVSSVAIIDSNGGISGLPTGLNSNASIYYFLVDGDLLYIGGSFTGKVNHGNIAGIAIYDLKNKAWSSNQPSGLAADDKTVVVKSINKRPNTQDIVVSGIFDRAGSLGCQSVCIFDADAVQWHSTSFAIGGQVETSVITGANTVLFAGNLTMNNSAAYLLQYDFNQTAWVSELAGKIKGPLNSLVLQGDIIYAAGSQNGKPYFIKTDGNTVTEIASGLSDSSVVYDIQLLPLKNDHSKNNQIPSDRILIAFGQLSSPTMGTASAAVYDGENWQAYILTGQSDGSPGIIYSIFSDGSLSTFSSPCMSLTFARFSNVLAHLAKGWVLLISLAISLGIIFILVAAGVIAAYFRRKKEGYTITPHLGGEKNLKRLPPNHLFSEFN
ncbi:Polarized growth protein rax2, partial [Neolecta irregularis DAH-3]